MISYILAAEHSSCLVRLRNSNYQRRVPAMSTWSPDTNPGSVWVFIGDLLNVRNAGAISDQAKLIDALNSVRRKHEEIINPEFASGYHFGGSTLACVAFIDLANRPTVVLKQLEDYRQVFPQFVFVLYYSQSEFKRLRNELPSRDFKPFLHYFRLLKSDDSTFSASVRAALDKAAALAYKKRHKIQRPERTRSFTQIASLILTTLIGLLGNVATGSLPDRWKPFLWFSWAPLGACLLIMVIMLVLHKKNV
jgi:hypothetical protein